jgi:hypothetical protein
MMKNLFPKITFGIIVLNGEPFTKYCLRSLYPFAYEIIVVEGGHANASAVCTPHGHSVDGTLKSLNEFKKMEDPENKVIIITRDDFWPQKDELERDRTPQSRAYAEMATGDYLWQIDIDEFYREDGMAQMINLLKTDPTITTVSIPFTDYWGDIKFQIDGWYKRRHAKYCNRIFKWGKNYKYVTHEPPIVVNEQNVDLRDIHWVTGEQIKKMGIKMYHYSHLFPWQVKQKTLVYNNEKQQWNGDILAWAENNYFKLSNPFSVERHFWLPSWLEYYYGPHPKEIIQMMADIRSGKVIAELRNNDDAEKVLSHPFYNLKVSYMKVLNVVDFYFKYFIGQALRVKNIPRVIKRNLKRKTN